MSLDECMTCRSLHKNCTLAECLVDKKMQWIDAQNPKHLVKICNRCTKSCDKSICFSSYKRANDLPPEMTNDDVYLSIYTSRPFWKRTIQVNKYMLGILSYSSWIWYDSLDSYDEEYIGARVSGNDVQQIVKLLTAIKGKHKFSLCLRIQRSINI